MRPRRPGRCPANTSAKTKPDTVRSRFIWPGWIARSAVREPLRRSPCPRRFSLLRCLCGLQELIRGWQSLSTNGLHVRTLLIEITPCGPLQLPGNAAVAPDRLRRSIPIPPMVPPMMPTIIIVIVVWAIVVGPIIVPARVVIIFGIVIPSIIGSVIARSTAKGNTEALRFRIVLAYRQQS
jgi:hypothetical protein